MHECALTGTAPDAQGVAAKRVAIVGIAPGREELKQGKAFVGPSGKLLTAILEAANLPRESLLVTNLVCHMEPEPSPEQVQQCWPRLKAELQGYDVVFAIGNPVIEALTGKPSGKARHIALYNTELEAWVIGTWHPSAALRSSNDDMVADMLRDFRKASLYVGKQPKDFEATQLEIVVSLEAATNQFKIWHDTREMLCLDVELPGPDFDVLECVAVGEVSTGKVIVLPRAVVYKIDWLWLANNPIVYHNAQFDTTKLREHLGVVLKHTEDTMLMSFSVDHRGGGDDDSFKRGLHGLKRLAGEYCGAGLYAEDINLKRAPTDLLKLYQYNALDVYYTIKLYHYMRQQQREHDVREVYKNLLMPASRVLTRIRWNGIPIDTNVLVKLAVEWTNTYTRLEADLQRIAQRAGWPGVINLNSPQQLSKYLYEIEGHPRPRTKSMSSTRTDVEALEQLDSEFVSKLREYRRVDKMLSTYVVGIERQLQDDGCVRPRVNIHGTRTGRFSYNDPPVQTIPRGFIVGQEYGLIRQMFGGQQGYTVFNADYEQAELWTAVIYSGDPQMLADLRSGDLHSKAAAEMFRTSREAHSPEEWTLLRNDSKYVTFGMAFGRGAGSLAQAELKAYSKDEVQEFIKRWYARYSVLREWGLQQRKLIVREGVQRTKSGRVFYYPTTLNYDQLNKAMNYPIQSTSHDFLLASLIELQPELERLGGTCWLDLHDAIVGHVPTDKLDEAKRITIEIMQQPRFGSKFGIPVEYKSGANWNDVK